MDEWINDEQTKVPPGSLDHLGKAVVENWEVVYREPYGRCVVALRDIKEGQVLFYDRPVVTGPKLNSGLICLGCYRTLTDHQYYACSKCGWTLCGPECEDKGYHPLECEVFSSANYKVNPADFGDSNPLYESILPLRCLLLKGRDKKKWTTLLAMESHDDRRKDTESWNYEQVSVCDFLIGKVGLSLTEAALHSMCGVLDVNCHEVRGNLSEYRNEFRVRGIYPLCAMLSHSCTPNTHHTIMDDLTMVMVAATDIAAGQQITGIYTHLLSGTTERRKHLRYGKFFDCVCLRCSDPTELGTYFSALRCTNKNCQGRVLCKNPLDENNRADYACDICGQEVSNSNVSSIVETIGQKMKAVGETDIKVLEGLLKAYEEVLHPNNYQMVSLKSSLSQMYGRLPGTSTMVELPAEELATKIQYCRDVLNIISVFYPGISRIKGLTIYELQVALLVQANRLFNNRLINKQHYLERLTEALRLISNAVHCLQFEPQSSFEGNICKIARASKSELEKWISNVELLEESYFVKPSLPAPVETKSDNCKLSSQDLSLQELLSILD